MLNSTLIYESELCAIAYEANKYPECETGGDLYGLWTADGIPVIFLATGPGKNAVHQNAQYQMDVEYEQKCESILIEQFGIHYLGDWHSHHKLNIYEPSCGDRDRIRQIFHKNSKITHMAEMIVNHAEETGKKEMVSAYIYNKLVQKSDIKIMKTKSSPIRNKLQMMNESKEFNLIEGKLLLNQIIIRKPEEKIYSNGKLENLPLDEKSTIMITLER